MGKASRGKKERKNAPKPVELTDDMILDRIRRHVCTRCENPTVAGAVWCRLCTHKVIEQSRPKWKRTSLKDDYALSLSLLSAYEDPPKVCIDPNSIL